MKSSNSLQDIEFYIKRDHPVNVKRVKQESSPAGCSQNIQISQFCFAVALVMSSKHKKNKDDYPSREKKSINYSSRTNFHHKSFFHQIEVILMI